MLDLEHNEPEPLCSKVGDCDPAALIFLGIPIGDFKPGPPTSDGTVGHQPLANSIEYPVWSRYGMIDSQNYEFRTAILIQIKNGDIAAFVFPRSPIRNLMKS
jgi:hypothetical protein